MLWFWAKRAQGDLVCDGHCTALTVSSLTMQATLCPLLLSLLLAQCHSSFTPRSNEILLPAAAVANSTHPEHVESVVKSRGKPSVTPMQRTRHLEATAHPATTPSPRSDLPRVPQSPPPSYLPFYLVLAVSVLVALTLLAHVTYLHVLSKQKGESLLVPRHLSDIPLAMRDRGPPMARIRPRVRF